MYHLLYWTESKVGISLDCSDLTELPYCIVNATDVIHGRAVCQMWNSRELRAVAYWGTSVSVGSIWLTQGFRKTFKPLLPATDGDELLLWEKEFLSSTDGGFHCSSCSSLCFIILYKCYICHLEVRMLFSNGGILIVWRFQCFYRVLGKGTKGVIYK